MFKPMTAKPLLFHQYRKLPTSDKIRFKITATHQSVNVEAESQHKAFRVELT